jgi:heme A synthase
MDDQQPTPARDEAARQAIILAFSVVGVIVMIWAQRHASDPDAARTVRMRTAKGAERAYAHAAAWAWRQAERARLAYERDRA